LALDIEENNKRKALSRFQVDLIVALT